MVKSRLQVGKLSSLFTLIQPHNTTHPTTKDSQSNAQHKDPSRFVEDIDSLPQDTSCYAFCNQAAIFWMTSQVLLLACPTVGKPQVCVCVWGGGKAEAEWEHFLFLSVPYKEGRGCPGPTSTTTLLIFFFRI